MEVVDIELPTSRLVSLLIPLHDLGGIFPCQRYGTLRRLVSPPLEQQMLCDGFLVLERSEAF